MKKQDLDTLDKIFNNGKFTEEKFDQFCEFMHDKMPEKIITKRNEKYGEVMEMMDKLKKYVLSVCDETTFRIERFPEGITLIANCIGFSPSNIQEFCEMISLVENIDFNPRSDGTLDIWFALPNIYEIVGIE